MLAVVDTIVLDELAMPDSLEKHMNRFGPGLDRKDAAANAPPNVGANLRRMRHGHRYSLETLARLSGVSRAMLGQIESGKSIPTITSIWKIATALGVSSSALLTTPNEAASIVIKHSAIRGLACDGGGFAVRPYGTADLAQPFELSELFIAPGHREEIPPGPYGARATLVVTAGVIHVSVNDAGSVALDAGDAILFLASHAHCLSNTEAIIAKAFLVVSPAKASPTLDR